MTRDEALRLLGLDSSATPGEIRIAHRELAQMLHPDKFVGNRKLRDRATAQMKAINAARDVLLGNAIHTRSSTRSRSAGAAPPTSPESIAFEAEATARAAETARLSVATQARTLRERRNAMASMAGAAIVISLLTSRASGVVGTFVFSIASMVALWGIVDAVLLTSQVRVLRKRQVDLVRHRNRADAVARAAREL